MAATVALSRVPMFALRHERGVDAGVSNTALHERNSCTGQNTMSLDNDTRKMLRDGEVRGEHLRAEHVTQAIVSALRREVGNDRHGAKKLASIADVKARTAENWLAGRHPMSLTHFFRLASQLPALASEARRLMGMADDLDPEFAAELARFQRIAAEKIARGRR